jgi:bifunctional DNase/RNase
MPICTELAGAQAIQERLLGNTTPRPTTHHVVAGVMAVLGGTLREALIHSIENHTYHAVLRIERGGMVHEVDTRPSDAVAMALMLEKPIRVRESVLDAVTSRRS